MTFGMKQSDRKKKQSDLKRYEHTEETYLNVCTTLFRYYLKRYNHTEDPPSVLTARIKETKSSKIRLSLTIQIISVSVL